MTGMVIISFFTQTQSSLATVTLTSPASNLAYSFVNLNYSFNEAPATGSIHLVFSSAGATRTINLSDAQTANFSFNTADLSTNIGTRFISVTGGMSIPDGTYSVTLSYHNGGGTLSTISITGVTIKTSTNAPTLISPSMGGTYTNSVPIQFILPDSPLSTSRYLNFTNGNYTLAINLKDTTQTSFNLDPTANIMSNSNIQSATANSIPSGLYTVSLTYQDSLSNAAASTSNSMVVIDYQTLIPTLTSPTSGTTYTSTIPIQFTLPENALSASRKLTFTNGSNNIVLTLKDSTLTSFTLDPTTDPITNSNVQSATATSIPDGTYSVSIAYQDYLGNPTATSTTTGVVLSHSTVVTTTPAVSTSGNSGSGCGYIEDRQKKNINSPFESFFWMSVCWLIVLAIRNKRVFAQSM